MQRTIDAGEAEELYRGGMTMGEVADEMGHSYNGVRAALERAGVERRQPARKCHPLLDDPDRLRRAVSELGTAGVAEEAGVSRDTVYARCREHGVELSGRGVPVATAELMADVLRVAEELGRPPSRPDYDERGRWAPHTVHTRVGKWLRAKECAQLTLEGGE